MNKPTDPTYAQQCAAHCEESEDIAMKIARDLMAIGDGPTPCQRIQFMGGHWPDGEIPQGGLCEAALVLELRSMLKKHGAAKELEKFKADKEELITALESLLDIGNRSADEYVRLYGFNERAADDNARAAIERASK